MPFQVVFTGCARDGFDRRDGIKQLSERFKLNFTQINRLLISGRSVIKKVDDLASGKRLVQKLWGAGWHAELVSGREVLVNTVDWAVESRIPAANLAGRKRIEENEKPSESVLAGVGCSVVVPAGWSVLKDLNRSAVLQAGNLHSNQFLVVLKQNLIDLSRDTSVTEYCAAQLAQCADSVAGGEIYELTKPLGQEYPSAAYGEVTAEVGGVPVQYLIACRNFSSCVYTLFLWCERKDFHSLREVFLGIVSEFSVRKSKAAQGQEAEANASRVELVT